MTIAIHAMTPGEAVIETMKAIRAHGSKVAPRGEETLELIAPEIRVEQPWGVCQLDLGMAGRGLNPMIGAYEALMLVGQTVAYDQLANQVPIFTEFAEEGILHGAYGHRVYGQLYGIVRLLKRDSDSRQAVVTIFNSDEDLDRKFKDIPCTIAIQFLIREDKLICRTMMRSNDVWLGMPYDLIQFCSLQGAIAKALGIEMGPYLHTATSMHLYTKHLERSYGVEDYSRMEDYEPMWAGESIGEISLAARDIINGTCRVKTMSRFERTLWRAAKS